jgi:hypothetical protein
LNGRILGGQEGAYNGSPKGAFVATAIQLSVRTAFQPWVRDNSGYPGGAAASAQGACAEAETEPLYFFFASFAAGAFFGAMTSTATVSL